MDHPTPPSLSLSISEIARSGIETAKLAASLSSLIESSPPGRGRPVLTLPGYGGGDSSMAVVRYFLDKLGYRTFKLDLGVNYEPAEERIQSVDDATRFRGKMVGLVVERVAALHEEIGEKLSLVGWSMGGLYAFDTARELPHATRMVVTLGSPYGDPRGTSTFKLLRWLNRSDVPIESQDFGSWLEKSRPGEGSVPIKILYSARDGIVAPDVARPEAHPSIECIEVDSSHVGFAANPEALRILARELA